MKTEQRVYIKGNRYRGDEVIKFLENLGGYNSYHLDGHNSNNYYFIDPIDGTIKNNTNASSLVFSFIKEFYKEISLPRWKPKHGDYYYFIYEGMAMRNTWFNSVNEDTMYKFGNCFRTKEEAEEAVDKIKKVLN